MTCYSLENKVGQSGSRKNRKPKKNHRPLKKPQFNEETDMPMNA